MQKRKNNNLIKVTVTSILLIGLFGIIFTLGNKLVLTAETEKITAIEPIEMDMDMNEFETDYNYVGNTSENDIRLAHTIVLEGQKDYVDNVKENELYLWQNEKGEDITGSYLYPDEKTYKIFEDYDVMLNALKKSKNEIILPKSIPKDYTFDCGTISYYLNSSNIDLYNPKKTKVSDNIYFNVYEFDDNTYKQICRFDIYYTNPNKPNAERIHYEYILSNSRRSNYILLDPDYIIKDNINKPHIVKEEDFAMEYLDSSVEKVPSSNPLFEKTVFFNSHNSGNIQSIKTLDEKLKFYSRLSYPIEEEVYSVSEVNISLFTFSYEFLPDNTSYYSSEESRNLLKNIYDSLYILK